MNLEKTRLFQGSYFGKIMNNMKLSSRSQFPWNTIFGPLDDLLLAQIGGQIFYRISSGICDNMWRKNS